MVTGSLSTVNGVTRFISSGLAGSQWTTGLPVVGFGFAAATTAGESRWAGQALEGTGGVGINRSPTALGHSWEGKSRQVSARSDEVNAKTRNATNSPP